MSLLVEGDRQCQPFLAFHGAAGSLLQRGEGFLFPALRGERRPQAAQQLWIVLALFQGALQSRHGPADIAIGQMQLCGPAQDLGMVGDLHRKDQPIRGSACHVAVAMGRCQFLKRLALARVEAGQAFSFRLRENFHGTSLRSRE